jgi:class 3 adenylate cyclase
MARLQRKRLSEPDEVRPYEPSTSGQSEIYDLDEMVIGRMTMNPGWQWSRDVGPIAGTDRCEYHHLGVALSGILRVEMPDGETMDIGPQEAFEIPPGHLAWVVGDEPWVAIDFRGARSYARPVSSIGDRVLETILFTDIVDSTGTLHRIGDAAWRDLLARHNEIMREQLDRFRGRDIANTGDGILAVFDGAARAVGCAVAMTRAVSEIGLDIRAGVHTGEVEHVPAGLRGLAVHLANRIMTSAGAGEVLVSATTAELVAGSGITFESRGRHELKGIPGERELLAVARPRSGT